MNTKTIISEKVVNDYYKKKQEVFLYRLIFLGLGSCFIWTGGHLFFHGHHLHLPFFNENAFSLKSFLDLCAFLLGITALWIGCSLRTAEELLRDYYKMHRKIIEHYAPGEEKNTKIETLTSIAIETREKLDGSLSNQEKMHLLIEANAQFDLISKR